MGGNLNFTIVANNYVPVTITVTKKDGTPFDMTGFTAFIQVFDPDDSASPVISYSSVGFGANIVITDNVLSFAFKPADTVNLQAQDYTCYVIEAVLLDTNQNPVTLTEGDERLMWGILTIRKQWAIPTASPGGTQVTAGDGTPYTWGDGTNTAWSE